jgi:hypothetical protein
MRLLAFALLALTILLPAGVSAQATLNKCVDANGKVTYSNLPCRNAREVHKVAIDPAPTPVRPQPAPRQAPVAPVAPDVRNAPAAPAASPAAVVPATPVAPKAPVISIEPGSKYIEAQPTTIKPAARGSASQCDALTEQLGRVFDKMDAARRVGATQEQMDTWSEEIKELELKKQQSGCF